ncbi:MAG: alpha/beta hydrolase [Fimbriimonadaceae bacterium]|nr:alpha/beta hydrolase [Fimbriimonadaceae bacterium]
MIAIVVGTVVFLGVGLYLLVNFLAARFSVYPIRFPQWISPGQLGWNQERVEISTEDGQKLRAWWCAGDSEWVLVFGHGYLMNRSEFVPLLSAIGAERPNAIFFDFRAHGGSSGRKCTFGIDEAMDVAAVYDFARKRVPGSKFVYIGSSMGAAAGVLAIARDPSDTHALWLDAIYGDLDEASRNWWKFVGGAKLSRVFASTHWFAQRLLGVQPKEVRMDVPLQRLSGLPIVFIHGGQDPLVSSATASRLQQAAGSYARVDHYANSSHGRARLDEPLRYNESFRAFFEELQDR